MIVESSTVDDGSAVVGVGIVGGEQFGGGPARLTIADSHGGTHPGTNTVRSS